MIRKGEQSNKNHLVVDEFSRWVIENRVVVKVVLSFLVILIDLLCIIRCIVDTC